jgi:steroid delta-isomerase-like uncharacterized protein
MSSEDNKDLVRRGYEALNQRNWAAFDELHVSDYVSHSAATTIQGLEAYKQNILMYITAFPDLHFTIENMIAEGDFVAVRHTARGTHQGNFMGIPPMGKQVTVTGMLIARVAHGKIIEEWGNTDWLGLLQQLGVVPIPGQAS